MEALSLELIITFSIYSFLCFYQQKWVHDYESSSYVLRILTFLDIRSYKNELRFQTFLTQFMGIATIYGIGFLIYFGYKIEWVSALILFAISLVIKGIFILVEAQLTIRLEYAVEYIASAAFILIPILGYRLLVVSGFI